jgi:hypothetical protein
MLGVPIEGGNQDISTEEPPFSRTALTSRGMRRYSDGFEEEEER